jgi:Predicted Zn-dependent peptidases
MGYHKETWISEKEFSEAKTFFKGSFSRNFTNTMSIANLLEIVQYYKLGADYFDKRDEIIDSLELESINQLASILFNSNELFFMIVGKPN